MRARAEQYSTTVGGQAALVPVALALAEQTSGDPDLSTLRADARLCHRRETATAHARDACTQNKKTHVHVRVRRMDWMTWDGTGLAL